MPTSGPHPRPAAPQSAAIPAVGFVSLGCPKALVDSETILTRLRAAGYRVVPTYAEADLVVVNTCGFINAAVHESLDAIGEALRENGRVVVTGCLGSQAEKVRAAHPAVLAVTGPHASEQVLSAVRHHLPIADTAPAAILPPAGLKLTPPHYAYVKIAEGCNHRCSFCVIPALRGDLASRAPGAILDEARALVDGGARELLLVAQDSMAYGVDLKYRTSFWGSTPVRARLLDLVDRLADLGAWLRLHYVYPYPLVDTLVERMAAGRLLPYLDVPFQHADPQILAAMRRPGDPERQLERIAHWRATCPGLTIRSTFIVGFPGETEAAFERLLDFLVAARLDRVGCFAYSPVDGAAANALPGAVPEAVKAERQARLMALQQEISRSALARRVGQVETVMVDALDGTTAIARGPGEAPEIDGVIEIAGGGHLAPGDFVAVRYTAAGAHDLRAELAG